MIRRSITTFLSFLIVLAIACPTPAVALGVFNFPLFYVPTSLDPVEDKLVSTYHIFQQVYDGLVAFDSNLRVVPGLAKSWTVSRDGKKYTFTLRKGVKFHNGNVVTAGDVTASLTRIFDPGNESASSRLLDRVAGSTDYRDGQSDSINGIRAVSEDQVVIELTEPYAPFLSVLAMPFTKIVPREMIEDPDNSLGEVPVGTGPSVSTAGTRT